MYACLAPYGKNITEDSIWKLDFLTAKIEDKITDIEAIIEVQNRWKNRDAKGYKETKLLNLTELIQLKKATN